MGVYRVLMNTGECYFTFSKKKPLVNPSEGKVVRFVNKTIKPRF